MDGIGMHVDLPHRTLSWSVPHPRVMHTQVCDVHPKGRKAYVRIIPARVAQKLHSGSMQLMLS